MPQDSVNQGQLSAVSEPLSLLPMLIGGLLLITIGMIAVAALT